MSSTVRVFLVDDHTILRQGLRRLFESEPGMEVVGEASDGREAVERSREVEADVILMDLAMPSLGGVEATRRILDENPGVRILILSMYADDEYAAQAIEAGVAGYVMKDASANELLGAVRAVAAGEDYFTPRLPARLRPVRHEARRVQQARLTPREGEVLKLLAEGHSVKRTAEILKLSPKTVDVHKTNLMKKLGIHNRVDLVKYAITKKFIVV